jgi:hypothetical protein
MAYYHNRWERDITEPILRLGVDEGETFMIHTIFFLVKYVNRYQYPMRNAIAAFNTFQYLSIPTAAS